VLGFYSGLSGRVRTVCLFSLYVVSLMFTASAFVWFYNVLKYLVFHYFISLSAVFICRFSWILWLFIYQCAFKMNRRVLDLKRLRISLLVLELFPIAEFHRLVSSINKTLLITELNGSILLGRCNEFLE
jgi:hypothetical protein